MVKLLSYVQFQVLTNSSRMLESRTNQLVSLLRLRPSLSFARLFSRTAQVQHKKYMRFSHKFRDKAPRAVEGRLLREAERFEEKQFFLFPQPIIHFLVIRRQRRELKDRQIIFDDKLKGQNLSRMILNSVSLALLDPELKHNFVNKGISLTKVRKKSNPTADPT